jgi:predicted RNA polymerase sigma factor
MKYMLLIYEAEQAWEKLSEDERQQVYGEYRQLIGELQAAGQYVSGKLDQYYLFHASRADLLRRLKRFQEAAMAYSRALTLTTNQVEPRYVRRRLSEVTKAKAHLG